MSRPKTRTVKTALAVLVVVLAAAGLLLHADVPQVPSNVWVAAGDMTSVRAGASGTLLPNGLVLVAGGLDANGVTASVERFSPDAAHFIEGQPMQLPRANHTATLLADGRVLVAGGTGASNAADSSAEIYDPGANVWIPAGSLNVARRGHTATLLADGRVLIAGGDDAGQAIDSLEIFDPAANLFTVVDGASSGARTLHAATALLDGRVMIAGGFDGTAPLASTSIFDPETNTVSAGPDLSTPRSGLTATTLLDGRVLVIGGAGASGELGSAETFDPTVSPSQFIATDNSLSSKRQNHLAFLLPHNNQVLIVGGLADNTPVAKAEYFTPWEGTNGVFCSDAICASGYVGPTQPATARAWATGSALSFPADKTIRTGPNDGLLVLAGGSGQQSSELFGFATVKTDKDDYAPGELVTITGSGWQPHEQVALVLREAPLYDEHQLLSVEADDTGNIISTEFSPDEHDLNIRFYLTAFGAASQAQTTFTDGIVKVQTNGPTVLFTWSIFTGSLTCSGAASSSGSVTTDTTAVSVGSASNSDSIQLTVPATASGANFVNWTGMPGSPTTTSTCVAGSNATNTYTANYAQVFSINNITANEGNGGTTTFTFAVTRSAGGSAESVHFSTANGTAAGGAACVAGVDYITLPDTKLNFGTSVLTNNVAVTVCGDTTIESDETFFVNLTTPSAGTIGDSQGVGTITNDDSPANTVPSIAFTASPGTANEGDTRTYDFAITDPDVGQTFAFVTGFPDCGTGGSLGANSINAALKTGTFQCSFPDGPANPTVRVQVQDSFSTPATSNIATVAVVVSNVAPTVVLSGPTSANEGETKTYTYTITDPGDDPNPTVTESCGSNGTKIDTAAVNSFDCTFPDGPASSTVLVSADDGDASNNVGSDSKVVTVVNVAPTATLSNNSPVNEGSPVTVTFAAQSDPSSADVSAGFHYAYSCDGSAIAITTYSAAGTSASQICTFGDNGSMTVLGRIFDKDSGYTDYTTNVVVNNVAPSMTGNSFSFNPFTGVANASVSFSDPGWLDVVSSTFDWAGVPQTPASIGPGSAPGPLTGTFNGSHTFAGCVAGAIGVHVSDDDSGSFDHTFAAANSLGVYSVAFMAPIKDGARNIVKLGNVLPVKIVVLDCNGSPVLNRTLTVVLVSGTSAQDIADGINLTDGTSVSSADTGNVMRLADGHYMYNLATKGLPTGVPFTIIIRDTALPAGSQNIATAAIELKK